jgi:AraC-like DNA-binding protein
MSGAELLRVALSRPVRHVHAGLCLARGTRKHPDRRIGDHELFFVRKGSLGIAEAGRDLTTAAGESLLLWPHRRHYGTEIVAAGAEFYWLHFVVDPPRRGEPTIAVPQHARPARPERLMELLHRFLHDQQTGRLTPASGSFLIMLMLSEIAEQRAATSNGEGTLAARVEAEIVRRFHLPISTAAIARSLGCNPDYLGRLYRRVHGRGIVDAINARRVAEAQRLLLEEPGQPLDQVARHCGWRNQAWFRRVFRRFTGDSPTGFRRAHARAHLNT